MTRRERLKRKLERRAEWAKKAEKRSDQHYNVGHNMLDAIPMGQPILIGHHSEKRDRAYRGRAEGHMFKFVEERKLAEHHESKAAGLSGQLDRSIFSDDPDAIENIEARISENEAKRERMKLINKLYRKGDAAGLTAIGIDLDTLKAKLAAAGGYWGSAPHLPYEMSNLGGRITADRKRLESIKRQNANREQAAAAPNGVAIVDCPEGYCRVTFADKPERAILDALKAAGFWWGQGSWAGKRDSLPLEVQSLVTGEEECNTFKETMILPSTCEDLNKNPAAVLFASAVGELEAK